MIPSREELIGQLRYALSLLESPKTEVAEFEVGDTEFSFDLQATDNTPKRTMQAYEYTSCHPYEIASAVGEYIQYVFTTLTHERDLADILSKQQGLCDGEGHIMVFDDSGTVNRLQCPPR